MAAGTSKSATGLAHPLPEGMRDLLPEEAAARRELARRVLERFALHGYQLVMPPAFELASVLERGLGTSALNDVVRFIEPESGEVAVLRPDMTPQVARMVATRLHDREPPFRLAYEGTVVRRRSSRARKHRQIPQVGVELCGVAGAEGDLELICLAADVLLHGVGLSRFSIDLSDAGIVRELLADVETERAREISLALSRKDELSLSELCAGLSVGAQVQALASLHGDRAAVVEAIRVLEGSPAKAAAERLLSLFDAATSRGLGSHLTVDAGEVRELAYYTGTFFSIYAEGPGEAVGGGGRYDDLLGRYGAPRPAVGLGLDLDRLSWAVRSSGSLTPRGRGVVVVGDVADPRVDALRLRGVPAVAMADESLALAYAACWDFLWVWSPSAEEQTIDDVLVLLEALARRRASRGDEPCAMNAPAT